MNTEAIERISNVASDLKFLKNEWDQTVDDHSLRRSSGLLRRLLVEGELGRAWRDAGFKGEPSVNVVVLNVSLPGDMHGGPVYAQAGGAYYSGMVVESILEWGFALSPDQVRARFQLVRDGLQNTELTLARLLDSHCIMITGVPISRRDLIKYVANKLGGVHPVDQRRSPDKPLDKRFGLLDSVYSQRWIADKNVIYFEILSIGQALVKSEDVQQFLDRADSLTE